MQPSLVRALKYLMSDAAYVMRSYNSYPWIASAEPNPKSLHQIEDTCAGVMGSVPERIRAETHRYPPGDP
eukprot:jgi/Botrbrau1/7347/Bobra.247_3s0040.1